MDLTYRSSDEDRLGDWIRERFAEHYRVVGQKLGTYGRIWILEANSPNVSPHRFVLKGLNPGGKPASGPKSLEQLFERELRMWLALPPHLNVVPGLGIELALREVGTDAAVPLMRAPYCDATLEDWMRPSAPQDRCDRLFALAQICNGLLWMYEWGVEGHGDLKPANILVSDLRGRFRLVDDPRSLPSTTHPWQVRVSDLGWADIWKELGFGPDRGWRPYLAPERLAGSFEPNLSDVWSVAVIGTELLTGVHPAGKETRRLDSWNAERWRKWCAGGRRHLQEIKPRELRQVLDAALAPDPRDRPDMASLRTEVCAVLAKELGTDALAVLTTWTEYARRILSPEQVAWSFTEASRLGGESLDWAIRELEDRQLALYSKDTHVLATGLTMAIRLAGLRLQRGSPDDRMAASLLAERAARRLLEVPQEDLVPLLQAVLGVGGMKLDPSEAIVHFSGPLSKLLRDSGSPFAEELEQGLKTRFQSLARQEWLHSSLE